MTEPGGHDPLLADDVRSASAHAGTEPDRLTRLLAAATAPGRPAELAGERAALAAFRRELNAGTAEPTQVGAGITASRPVLRRALALFTVKVGVTLAVVAAGGVALAAGVGVLPVFDSPTMPVSSGPAGRPAPPPGEPSTHAVPLPTVAPHTSAAPPRSSSHAGLCRAYLAAPASQRNRVLDKPEYKDLWKAAGNKTLVEEYCTALLNGRQPAGSPSERGRRHEPDGKPQLGGRLRGFPRPPG